MIKSVISLLTCGILVLGIAFQSAAQNQEEIKERVTTTQQIKLNIEGMACSYCEKNAEKSLEKLEGVKVESVSASEGVAQLTFTGTEPISDEKLKEAVENAGYKLTKVVRKDPDDGADH